MSLSRLDLQWLVWMAACAALAGCSPKEPITRYTVPKPELIDPTLTAVAAPDAAAKPQQMLGVIVPLGEQSWFFKLMGDPAAVEPARGAFLNFVKSVKFSAAESPQPSWKLPEGWKELPPKQFGFATVGFESVGQPVEIAISSARGDLLTNLNRWHGQVGLPPISQDELPAKTEVISVDGREATFVSLVGTSSGRGGAPFAPFAGGGAMPPVTPPRPASASGGMVYDVPPEWSPAENDAVSSVAFQATDGTKVVKITISAVGGSLLTNVSRWRVQVKLPETTADELSKSVTKIGTFGVQGDYVELVGPEETILGVRAEAGGATWFIKLKGSRNLAAREKARFEAFVKSVKIK